MNIFTAISTVGNLGRMGPAPGTVASLAAVLVAWPIQIYGGAYALLAATIAVFAIGWWAVANYQQQVGVIDAPEIVVDEVAGMWLTLSFAPPQIIYFVVGFALFRLFDISKPWPVSWADRQLKGGLGVMMDDVLAGLYAIFCLWVIAWIVHQAGLA